MAKHCKAVALIKMQTDVRESSFKTQFNSRLILLVYCTLNSSLHNLALIVTQSRAYPYSAQTDQNLRVCNSLLKYINRIVKVFFAG